MKKNGQLLLCDLNEVEVVSTATCDLFANNFDISQRGGEDNGVEFRRWLKVELTFASLLKRVLMSTLTSNTKGKRENE